MLLIFELILIWIRRSKVCISFHFLNDSLSTYLIATFGTIFELQTHFYAEMESLENFETRYHLVDENLISPPFNWQNRAHFVVGNLCIRASDVLSIIFTQ